MGFNSGLFVFVCVRVFVFFFFFFFLGGYGSILFGVQWLILVVLAVPIVVMGSNLWDLIWRWAWMLLTMFSHLHLHFYFYFLYFCRTMAMVVMGGGHDGGCKLDLESREKRDGG